MEFIGIIEQRHRSVAIGILDSLEIRMLVALVAKGRTIDSCL